jgi:hypothetical protein
MLLFIVGIGIYYPCASFQGVYGLAESEAVLFRILRSLKRLQGINAKT